MKTKKNKQLDRHLTEVEKDRAIALAKEIGPVEAAKMVGVTYVTLHKWYKKKYGTSITGRKWEPYSEERKKEVVEYALSTSISEAAKYSGICRDTIAVWIKKDEDTYNKALEKGLIRICGPNHSQEQIDKGIYLIKQGVKRSVAARYVGVSVKVLEYWLRYSDRVIGLRQKYHNTDKEEVIKYAKEHKISDASKKYNIPYATIWNWIHRKRRGGVS